MPKKTSRKAAAMSSKGKDEDGSNSSTWCRACPSKTCCKATRLMLADVVSTCCDMLECVCRIDRDDFKPPGRHFNHLEMECNTDFYCCSILAASAYMEAHIEQGIHVKVTAARHEIARMVQCVFFSDCCR